MSEEESGDEDGAGSDGGSESSSAPAAPDGPRVVWSQVREFLLEGLVEIWVVCETDGGEVRYKARVFDRHAGGGGGSGGKNKSAAKLPAVILQMAGVLEDRIEIVPRSESARVREVFVGQILRQAWRAPAGEAPRDPFFAPKPVALTRANALSDELFAEHFAVTPKADGERAFLVAVDGKAYVLLSDMTVVSTGVRLPREMDHLWLDGELIPGDRQAGGRGRAPIFAAFDAYLESKGAGSRRKRRLVDEPLVPVRDGVVEALVKKLRGRVGPARQIVFEHKPHVHEPTIDRALGRLESMRRNGRLGDYETDRYIFTPRNVGVFQNIFGRQGRVRFGSTRQSSLLKWKPAGELTIDVALGESVGTRVSSAGVRYVGFRAMAGGNRDFTDEEAAAALAALEAGETWEPEGYTLVPVPDAVVWFRERGGRPVVGAEVVEPDAVVEVVVDPFHCVVTADTADTAEERPPSGTADTARRPVPLCRDLHRAVVQHN